MKKLDWNKPITFDAAKEGFEVMATKDHIGWKISSAHYGYYVNKDGKPCNSGLGDAFKVKNIV